MNVQVLIENIIGGRINNGELTSLLTKPARSGGSFAEKLTNGYEDTIALPDLWNSPMASSIILF